ncbi:alpha/beta hydrolase [Candidatus Margulisiibacteriota bacterium]
MNILLSIITALVGFNLLIEPLIEGSLIYFPSKEIVATPKDAGMEYEDIYLTTSDNVRINLWHIGHQDSRKIVLFFHGNGANMSYLLPVMEYFHEMPAASCFVDYRGYGLSGGKPTEKKLYADARQVYRYLIDEKHYKPQDIILWGWSLGASVAIDLAVDHEVGGIIVHSGMTSVKDMSGRVLTPILKPFVWVRSKFDNLAKLPKLKCPTLFIYSKTDSIIPYKMGVRNFEAANTPKHLITLADNTHEDFEFGAADDKTIRDFILKQNLPAQ